MLNDNISIKGKVIYIVFQKNVPAFYFWNNSVKK